MRSSNVEASPDGTSTFLLFLLVDPFRIVLHHDEEGKKTPPVYHHLSSFFSVIAPFSLPLFLSTPTLLYSDAHCILQLA